MILDCFQEKYGNVELLFNLEDEVGFFLKNEREDIAQLNNPLDYKETRTMLAERNYVPEEYEVVFLLKKDIKESDITPVRYRFTDDYKNIGFLIPILALESTEHEYAQDRHFLLYSYIATVELLKNFPQYSYVKDIIFNGNKFIISDLVSQDLVIGIFWKKDIESLTISSLSVCLFEEGYVGLSSRLPSELVFSKKNIESLPEEGAIKANKLSLKLLNSDVVDHVLIEKILFLYFPYEKNPPFKFFLLYQIVELLMSYILQNEYDLILSQLQNTQQNNIKSRDILDKIKEFTAEKKRITLLFNNYSSVSTELSDLRKTSIAYIEKMIDADISSEKKCEEYFYLIRNFIVHNMISLNEANNNELEEVNEHLTKVIPSILNTFKKRNIQEQIT
ncbi:Uncharacterised protein [Cedecea lapagei]|uniref:Uncharacterized protein n=1 Tax=Cedecea lapagei TaxID=158823 RepID=A0A3S4IFG3_9ENTR|nr:hypothetical protein [Cedecea lapagei]VEB95347.1 Uncharacterised protein [Cedecea lapagei]